MELGGDAAILAPTHCYARYIRHCSLLHMIYSLLHLGLARPGRWSTPDEMYYPTAKMYEYCYDATPGHEYIWT